jgi:RNA polymerase sigma-70 factor, ECF subfamily
VTDEIRQRIVEFLPRLRRFVRVLTAGNDGGDDVVQETVARALSRIDQWQPGTRLDSWMFRIAQTIWLDRLRAQRVRGEAVDIDAMGDLPGEDGRHVAEHRLMLNKVSEGIARLSPEQQMLIALIVVDGVSYKEAANILDIPIGTVMSRLARARLSLYEFADGTSSEVADKKGERRGGPSK